MQITYLINQYPKVSHSFIRREILALERQGFEVQRIAIRGWNEPLVDPLDIEEKSKTAFLLQAGLIPLLISFIKCLFCYPARLLSSLALVFRLHRTSDRGILLHLITLMESCKTVDWVKSVNSSMMHAHFGTNSAEIAMYASILSGIPYSFTVHGPEEFDKPVPLNLNLKASYASAVFCISSFGRSQLYRWINYSDWSKVHVVHCGLEPSFYKIDIKNEIPRVPHQFVCVGRLCEQKGQLLLIEAVRELKALGKQFHLILAGDGEMRSEIESLIHLYGLEKYVSITGWVSSDKVKQLLLSSSAMVLPSFAEGLPVVIMEAMSLKCPVVSTYVAGIPELVKNGENGWLVPAGDVQALSQTLEKVMDTEQGMINTMAEQGRMAAISRHSIETESIKLAHIFREVTMQ